MQKRGIMRFNARAQAAMEFLMIYGWAVFSVLATIAILAYLGVLSPEKLLPEKCTIDSGITCISSKVQIGQITLVLLNSAQGKTLTINNIDVEGCTGNFNQELGSGSQATFSMEESCNNGEIKDKFNGQIKIKYTENPSGLAKTAYGSISTRVEE
jgi:hypothetical protein